MDMREASWFGGWRKEDGLAKVIHMGQVCRSLEGESMCGPSSRAPRPLALLALMLLSLAGASGCASGLNRVTGNLITPEHFRFKDDVPEDGQEPSGWRAVCIHALIKQGDSGAWDVCKFEVGMPLRDSEGRIPLRMAQEVAAAQANRAAWFILSTAHPGEMLAVLCNDYKRLYEKRLREMIPGSRVGVCRKGVEVVHFDVPYPYPCEDD